MTGNVSYEIAVCQLHHVLSAALLSLTTYVLVTWADLIAYFVETLNATNSKRSLFCPDFDCYNSRVGYFADNGSICKPLSLLSRKSFLVVLEVSLVRYGFLIWIFDFIGGRFHFLSRFLFALLLICCEIGFNVIFSHFDFEFIDLIL